MKKVLKSMVILFAFAALIASCNKESSEKDILSFKFVTPDVEATISQDAKTIVAVVPFGTDVTALVPVITISDKATVSPASGTPTNFTNPVTFTVTAEDGSQATYTATVTFDNGGGGGGNGDPTHFSGDIDANTTWHDLGLPVDYVIDGYVTLNGNALLTVEPGVTIMFTGVDGGFEVGENAGLRMVGTAEKPIVLEGPANNPNNGSWGNVVIRSKRNDNQFEYVRFLRGGHGDGDWDGVIHLINGTLSMKSCIIDGGLGNGLVTEYDSYLTGFEKNTIKHCDGYPWITENFPALCKNIGSGNEFTGNDDDFIKIGCNVHEFNESLTLPEADVPYLLNEGGFEFIGDKIFTILPGVIIEIDENNGIYIGEELNFVAEGTAEKPIIFRCEDNNEYWNGLHFQSTRNHNSISYCHFKDVGANEGYGVNSGIYIRENARLSLTNNVFGPSAHYGVGIESIEQWGNVTHSGNSFTNCAGGNVWIEIGGEYNGETYEYGQILNDLP
ncbi:MAG: DUF5018 domain-containing protein [Bacteroidales bacterium]|nr:DUF5018 domain-containing protein [Bacteroidales bacterium]